MIIECMVKFEFINYSINFGFSLVKLVLLCILEYNILNLNGFWN